MDSLVRACRCFPFWHAQRLAASGFHGGVGIMQNEGNFTTSTGVGAHGSVLFAVALQLNVFAVKDDNRHTDGSEHP